MLATNLPRIRCKEQEPLQQFIVLNNKPYNIRIFTKRTLTKETFIPLVTNWQNKQQSLDALRCRFHSFLFPFMLLLFCFVWCQMAMVAPPTVVRSNRSLWAPGESPTSTSRKPSRSTVPLYSLVVRREKESVKSCLSGWEKRGKKDERR